MAAGGFEHRDAPRVLQSARERGAVVAGQPVGHPVGVEAALGQHLDRAVAAVRVGLPRLRGSRTAARAGRRRLKIGWFRLGQPQAAPRGRPVAPAWVRSPSSASIRARQSRRLAQLASVTTSSGASLAAPSSLAGLSIGPASPTMSRNRQHAQQQQPPRRAVADLLVVLEPEQQHHAGKHPPDRRGRHRPQDQPQAPAAPEGPAGARAS